MTRDLIETAKAVIADRDHLGAMFEWEGNDVLTSPNAVRWRSFVAAVRAAEAATVADDELVREAASEALAALFNTNDATPEGQQRLVADAIRPYIAPAPVADTVAVPVEKLRKWRDLLTKDGKCYVRETHRMFFANTVDVIAEITALLPPPPAPEPGAELVETWKLEAAAAMEHVDLIRERIMFQQGYVARARAEWVRAKKGGG